MHGCKDLQQSDSSLMSLCSRFKMKNSSCGTCRSMSSSKKNAVFICRGQIWTEWQRLNPYTLVTQFEHLAKLFQEAILIFRHISDFFFHVRVHSLKKNFLKIKTFMLQRWVNYPETPSSHFVLFFKESHVAVWHCAMRMLLKKQTEIR